MLTFVCRAILLSLAFVLATPAMAAPGDREFKQGISAFKAGKYDQAITSFNQAHEKGKTSSALTYNLGVCYYKTKQYDKAAQNFSQLLGDQQFRQLAQYNLGLVNLAQQHQQAAINWFSQAADKHGNRKITELANRMLEKYAPHKIKRRFSGLLSVGYGHDSNVTLASTGSPTQQADNYLQLFGFISIPAGPVTVNASLYQQDYRSVNSADFMQLSAGVLYPIETHAWTFTPAIYLAKETLNSNDFQTVTDVRFTADKLLAAQSKLLLRYRYSDISADSAAYNYLQGSRQQFRVQHNSLTSFGLLRLRYELEINDRQNLSTANYSPTRHTLLARLKQRLDNWQVREQVSWRKSHYGAAAGITRDDDRIQLSLGADSKLGKDWRVGAKYEYTDNNSNLASETYTRNDIRGYLNYLF